MQEFSVGAATNPHSFGKAVADLRKSRGIPQKEIVARVSAFYSEESAYRRIESGRRLPNREAAIAILRYGLELTDVDLINPLIALAGYGPLNAVEVAALGLEGGRTPVLTVKSPTDYEFLNRFDRPDRLKVFALAVTAIAFSLACAVVFPLDDQPIYSLTTSTLYSALYVVSLLLESAYEPNRKNVRPACVVAFALMLVSSVAALGIDSAMTRAGNNSGLLLAFLMFVGAAVVQAILLRGTLSDQAIVTTRFQAHTAQAAHLKNTAYYLLIVIVFWLPTFNCVSVLHREIQLGRTEFVRSVLQQHLLVGNGILSLSATVLAVIFLSVIGISIAMNAHLTENLRPHPRLNVYSALIYLRAAIGFSLCATCLGWYAYSLGALQL